MLARLGAARVVLIGDSLMEQTFDALKMQLLLESGATVTQRGYGCASTRRF